ncbi:MAG TPA: hypothetical protein EYH03_00560 [Chromatiales bacterium]|nr:hypothetical protein [Chromatiales bacterium]
MDSNQGFIDLRLNRQETLNEESFWPSFTDIMTVIVMIFLLSMVVLLIRNMELVKQLRATMEAERTAAELARTTGEEKESLALRLHSAESELSALRMQLMRMEEQREQQEAAIASQVRQISQLTQTRDDLYRKNDELQRQNIGLTDKISSMERTVTGMRTDMDTLRNRHQITLSELEELRRSYNDRERELELAQARLTESDSALATLRSEYSSLETKYNKLIRPARTASGKYVVEVRYQKINGESRIAIKEPGRTAYQSTTRKDLHARLSKLKERYPKDLYVKVIIPKKSGLTYNEAYSFTTELHKKYDYYFQEPTPAPQAEPQ